MEGSEVLSLGDQEQEEEPGCTKAWNEELEASQRPRRHLPALLPGAQPVLSPVFQHHVPLCLLFLPFLALGSPLLPSLQTSKQPNQVAMFLRVTIISLAFPDIGSLGFSPDSANSNQRSQRHGDGLVAGALAWVWDRQFSEGEGLVPATLLLLHVHHILCGVHTDSCPQQTLHLTLLEAIALTNAFSDCPLRKEHGMVHRIC